MAHEIALSAVRPDDWDNVLMGFTKVEVPCNGSGDWVDGPHTVFALVPDAFLADVEVPIAVNIHCPGDQTALHLYFQPGI